MIVNQELEELERKAKSFKHQYEREKCDLNAQVDGELLAINDIEETNSFFQSVMDTTDRRKNTSNNFEW